MPRVSVVIPCYNQGHFIREAIASVEGVPEKDLYEVIIVNDGSTDADTIAQMRALEQEGYRVVNQSNAGLGAARNSGIRESKGEYILPLDSDNRIRSEYIGEGIRILDSNQAVSVVYGDLEYFGEEVGRREVGAFSLQRQMLSNSIDACAVYRRSCWVNLGGYDERMPAMGFEDWDFWLRIAFSGGRFHYVRKVLFDYRCRSGSMVRSVDKQQYVILHEYMQEKYRGFLDQTYLWNSMMGQKRFLAAHMLLATLLPGPYRYLLGRGLVRKKYLV